MYFSESLLFITDPAQFPKNSSISVMIARKSLPYPLISAGTITLSPVFMIIAFVF
jgi:hypothetical protein